MDILQAVNTSVLAALWFLSFVTIKIHIPHTISWSFSW